jgi:hypothetical protein
VHPATILLSGVVGSTAYGLSREGSDVDRLGIFAAPTEQLHGLHAPKDSHVTHHPDQTLHEAAKWCRLALSVNPTVIELVWLPDDLYEIRTGLGDDLIAIRSAFLSAPRVRTAYLGYATQQFRRLVNRGDGSFSADTRKRTAKHARHLRRLCEQGLSLYTTGRLDVRVHDPNAYFEFGEAVVADADHARPYLIHIEEKFDAAISPLPDRPDEAPAEAWLRRVRRTFYDGRTA